MALSPTVRDQMKKKFEILFYFLRSISLLQSTLLDLGSTYKDRDLAPNFIYFIAESQRQCLCATLDSTNCPDG